MKRKIILSWALLGALSLLTLTFFSASACGPDEDIIQCNQFSWSRPSITPAPALPKPTEIVTNPLTDLAITFNNSQLTCILPDGSLSTNALGLGDQCILPPAPKLAPKPTAVVVAAVAPKEAAPKPQPKGDSLATAIDITDTWQTVPAASSLWFKTNNFTAPRTLQIYLDAYGKSGLDFAVYAPDQIATFSADTKPIGRGTPNKQMLEHDLIWSGGSRGALGTWYVLLSNRTPDPIQYKLSYNMAVTNKNCSSYWEFLPNGQYVYWTACN